MTKQTTLTIFLFLAAASAAMAAPPDAAKDKAVADKHGVKLIAYEGGQHMVAFVKDQALVKQLSATMHACSRHPRVGQMYTRYFDHWAQIGGDVFAVFSSIGQYSNHGAWGLAEYYDSRPADYPKLDATLRGCEKIGTGTFATADFPGFSPFPLEASPIFSQPLWWAREHGQAVELENG